MPGVIDPQELRTVFGRTLAPRPSPTLWAWSASRIVIPDAESSSLGSFSTSRSAPFRRALDILSARKLKRSVAGTDAHAAHCRILWVVWSAQCGKTISTAYPGFSWCCRYFPHQPTVFYWPSKDVRKAQIRDRLEPMWQSTPDLCELLPPLETDDYRSAIGERTWRLINGMRAALRVANIANDLRSNPFCNIFFDEFDVLKLDVGEQGDPMGLAIDRQRTFDQDALAYGVTTPSTVTGHGWRKLCGASHERLLVECTSCHGMSWPNPDQIHPLENTDAQEIARRDLAAWSCPWCGAQYQTDAWRALVITALSADRWAPGTWNITDDHPTGQWTPDLDLDDHGRWQGSIWPEVDRDERSIHGNILMTDVWTLGRFLSEEMKALAGSEQDQQRHWNTARAEPYFPRPRDAVTEDGKNAVIVRDLQLGTIPAAAQWVVLMFDQQGSTNKTAWFPYVVRAVAPGGESWLIEAGKVPQSSGDGLGGWDGVESLCLKHWTHADGRQLKAHCVAMDGANGVMAAEVRGWAARQPERRIVLFGNARLAQDEPWRVFVPSKRSKIPVPAGVRIFEVNSNYWRDRLDDRRRKIPGALSWHITHGAPPYYLRSIWESEVRVVKQRQITGQGMRDVVAWEPAAQPDQKGGMTYRRDNHWWDCEVSIACLMHIGGWDKSRAVTPPSLSINKPAAVERRPVGDITTRRSVIERRRIITRI